MRVATQNMHHALKHGATSARTRSTHLSLEEGAMSARTSSALTDMTMAAPPLLNGYMAQTPTAEDDLSSSPIAVTTWTSGRSLYQMTWTRPEAVQRAVSSRPGHSRALRGSQRIAVGGAGGGYVGPRTAQKSSYGV